jgi:large subunit ribosomal protein L10
MALTKTKKQEVVKEVGDKIDNQKAMVFIDFQGTDVKTLTNLRKSLRESGNELKVAKKSLVNVAFQEKNIDVDMNSLEGELGLVFGYEDEISPSKTIYNFSKENKTIKILGGYLDNLYYNAEDTVKLAQIPGREQLLANLVGTMNAPVSNFVGVLGGTIGQFVRVLSQIKDNK